MCTIKEILQTKKELPGKYRQYIVIESKEQLCVTEVLNDSKGSLYMIEDIYVSSFKSNYYIVEVTSLTENSMLTIEDTVAVDSCNILDNLEDGGIGIKYK